MISSLLLSSWLGDCGRRFDLLTRRPRPSSIKADPGGDRQARNPEIATLLKNL
jgi:hypothetical protein